jgi:hypothetical protein
MSFMDDDGGRGRVGSAQHNTGHDESLNEDAHDEDEDKDKDKDKDNKSDNQTENVLATVLSACSSSSGTLELLAVDPPLGPQDQEGIESEELEAAAFALGSRPNTSTAGDGGLNRDTDTEAETEAEAVTPAGPDSKNGLNLGPVFSDEQSQSLFPMDEALDTSGFYDSIPQQSVVSADDFLPMFTFVVVQAALPQLIIVKELMTALVDDEETYGECGYYLATLEASTQHIVDLAEQYNDLKNGEDGVAHSPLPDHSDSD